jgi:allantoate deiminase
MRRDIARDVIHRCRVLAACSEDAGVTTRTFLSPPMRAVHEELSGTMQRAGMEVRVDAVGNLRGVYAGDTPDAPRLFIGSHLDTIPRAGAFDGVLGVVLGVALVDMLAPRRLPFGIEVVGFSEEEGVRFGVPFIGSRALAGTIDADLLATCDARGITVRQALLDFGLDPSRIPEEQVTRASVGYLEFHIEQGPVLDRLARPLGIVDRIVGQTRAEVTFMGMSAHAGTTPMGERRDALAGAAEWMGAVEREAAREPGTVATVGQLTVSPGASNVVPGECRATLDVRHGDDTVRHAVVARLQAMAREIVSRRKLTLDWQLRLDQPATPMDGALVDLLARAAEETGMEAPRLASGAGHDAMVLASCMPAAMLFVRSPHGISHHPEESVEEADVAAALTTGLRFLDLLAETLHG